VEDVDEAELVERAKTSPLAFGQLYYEKILGCVYRRTLDATVAEELTSNTFFNALRALPAYEHRGRFAAWLYRIATNEIKIRRRNSSIRIKSIGSWQGELSRVYFASSTLDGEEDAEEKMRAFARLHEALYRLPDKYQVVISLRYFEAMPHVEIAEVLGKRLGTVKSLLHRGLKQLKRQYQHQTRGEGFLP